MKSILNWIIGYILFTFGLIQYIKQSLILLFNSLYFSLSLIKYIIIIIVVVIVVVVVVVVFCTYKIVSETEHEPKNNKKKS